MDEHVISGRYRPLEQLGRGGMGVVWRARDLRLGRVVAIKVLHPWVADDPELRERFEREAAALARLEHPNVVRLYDVLEDRGPPARHVSSGSPSTSSMTSTVWPRSSRTS